MRFKKKVPVTTSEWCSGCKVEHGCHNHETLTQKVLEQSQLIEILRRHLGRSINRITALTNAFEDLERCFLAGCTPPEQSSPPWEADDEGICVRYAGDHNH
jgi:hypothetical protein